MFIQSTITALLATASLTAALPHFEKDIGKRSTEQEILNALAGTYTLVNTTRYTTSLIQYTHILKQLVLSMATPSPTKPTAKPLSESSSTQPQAG